MMSIAADSKLQRCRRRRCRATVLAMMSIAADAEARCCRHRCRGTMPPPPRRAAAIITTIAVREEFSEEVVAQRGARRPCDELLAQLPPGAASAQHHDPAKHPNLGQAKTGCAKVCLSQNGYGVFVRALFGESECEHCSGSLSASTVRGVECAIGPPLVRALVRESRA